MNNVFDYVTKCGLTVRFLKKKGFSKVYCGIGCKYGGAYTNYSINGKKYKSPDGIAHFIEHKLFQMPDGSDAFTEFSKLGAKANAYTQQDKVQYFFKKTGDFYEPLKLLLNMYFTPVFNDEDVEREKDIIVSEIEMYNDNKDARQWQRIMDILYPNDPYSRPLAGTEEDVRSTTVKDMYEAYKAFYTPSNSVLVIVGDEDENILFDFIEKCLDGLEFSYCDTIKLKTIKSKKPTKGYEYTDSVFQDEAIVLLRLDDITNKDLVSCEKIIGVLDTILSISSSFQEDMMKKKLFENDIDYSVITTPESSFVVISAPSSKPNRFINTIFKKLNNLSLDDIDEELLEIYLRHLKSKSIGALDNIDYLGDQILSLALEDLDYFSILNNIINLKKDDFIDTINSIKNSMKSYLITKMKNN